LRPEATSGDMGVLDEDGYLTLWGRACGVINVAGVKVFPGEIEAVLKKCPGVRDAAVTALPDQVKGEKICAWIVRQDKTVTRKNILNFCHNAINIHACPQKIVFTEELPLNNNGKVDKKRLREQV
jgi:long-chain acyl-CoA synthetase